jgi:branched-chain amino acid transport system ATP-binding protein
MSLLSVTSLDAGYRDVTVVRGVTFSVEKGEILSILGANGAGKSTTLLAIAGLAEAHAGTVAFAGTTITSMKPERIARSGLSLVPEDRALFTKLTVSENLRLGAHGDGSRVPVVLENFPALAKLGHRQAGTLSGGEQQMLALARALVARPSLLLVDELSLGLAPMVVTDLLATLRRIADDQGLGVVLVEQHVPMAAKVSDRFVVLSRGRLTLEGSREEMQVGSERLRQAYLGGDAA